MMIGELADLIYSSSFVLVATIVYKYRRTFKGALLGLGIAFGVQLLVSGLANYFVIYHLYNNLFSAEYPFTAKKFIIYVIPLMLLRI